MTFFDWVAVGLAAVLAGFLVYRLVRVWRAYLAFRGQRLVTCPETRKTVTVEVAAGDAAVETLIDPTDRDMPHLHLKSCTRWPERQNCGQDCLSQVEADPQGCLVWNIVNDWYQGKKCAYCGHVFSKIHWHDHPPALIDAQKRTVLWRDVRPEQLPELFRTHLPVCWNCHIAETFRREHADLVTDRAPH